MVYMNIIVVNLNGWFFVKIKVILCKFVKVVEKGYFIDVIILNKSLEVRRLGLIMEFNE